MHVARRAAKSWNFLKTNDTFESPLMCEISLGSTSDSTVGCDIVRIPELQETVVLFFLQNWFK